MSVRRLVWVVGAVVFVDTLFYAVIAPLLPQLSHQLHMSKLAAGVMTAGYPAGMLVASIPGGVLAMRAGPRLTVCAGLALMAVSTLAFGLLHSAIALDAARFLEGVGGACSWAGGLAWLVAATPVGERGATMGKSLGASIGGALFGPALGALASAIGRPIMFGVLAGVALALIAVTRTFPDSRPDEVQRVSALRGLLGRRAFIGSMWLLALPAIVSGAVTVLAPLRMHHLGAGAGVIGVTFLVGAGFESLAAPAVGRLSDRQGRMAPMRIGLGLMVVALACFTLPRTEVLLAVTIVATMTLLAGFWAPSMALISELAEAAGIDQALAAALMNLAWAGGQIIGSAGSGAISKSFGDIAPSAGAAVLCALTLAGVSLRRRPRIRE